MLRWGRGVGLVAGYIGSNHFYRLEECESINKKYKYVVIGSGVAGQAAINELVKDKNSSILVIEKKKEVKGLLPQKNGLELCDKTITQLDPSQHLISFSEGVPVKYEKLLIASGRQYGIMNFNLIDKRCVSKILSLSSENSISKLTEIVKNGGHVTLLGGSWVSVALASYLAHEASLSGYTSSITVLMPGSGPLHEVLPRYYSLAIQNRLRRIGVEVYPYMQLRYIGVKESLTDIALPTSSSAGENLDSTPTSPNTHFNNWDDVVGVHCVQSYDSIQTYMFATDVIVPVCENINNFGLGVCSIQDKPSSPDNNFLSQCGLEMDSFGCIVVNPSLSAAQDIFVAGDIANMSGMTGRGYDVGTLSASATGSIAAKNMMSDSQSTILSTNILNTYHAKALLMGGNIRFYGDCSTHLDTYGFWWNNKRQKQDKPQTVTDLNIIDEKEVSEEKASRSYQQPYGKLSTRKILVSPEHIPLNFSLHSPAPSKNDSIHQSEIDILGTGIIFYVDSSRVIRGIAVCGTKGNPFFLNNCINMTPAYTHAAGYLGHYIDIPTVPSKQLTSAAPPSSIDINNLIKYLEKEAIDIFQRIEISSPSSQQILFNELEDKPKSKYVVCSKKPLLKISNNANKDITLIERAPWRWNIQTSNKNERIFHRMVDS